MKRLLLILILIGAILSPALAQTGPNGIDTQIDRLYGMAEKDRQKLGNGKLHE